MADKYIVTRTDMESVADELRIKSGKSDSLVFPDGWKGAIKGLSAEEQLKASEYPSYVSPEVLEVVNKVRDVQKSDSITFIAMSDSHYPAEQTNTSDYVNNKASTVQANQAMKSMAYLLDVDFVAHLGDVCAGAGTTTPDMLKSQIEGFLSYFKEAKSDIPVFLAIGNHDPGIYYHDEMIKQGNTGVYTMTGKYLYDMFTSQSASDNTVFGDSTYGGYCYRDFPEKKLRVFLLNTSEEIVRKQADDCTLAAQRLWFANAMIDLNTKANAAEWGFVVLCHYPADYGGGKALSDLLKAYVTGGSITIKGDADENFTSTTVNFSGKNGARFIAQFHGHVHNFLVDRLYGGAVSDRVNGTPTEQYDGYRIAVPNVQYNRENYYYNTDAASVDGTLWGIKFFEGSFAQKGEDGSHHKNAGTANGTSFVVNVINPSEEKIYSFCYGAGYDRVVGYGAVTYYSITRSFTNVSSDNTAVSIEEGQPYAETITLASGCDMQTITVTMGGVDISSTAIASIDGGYEINIAEVTGNIVITAKAQARPNFTNLVPLSINADGTDFNVDGDGYDNGMYLSGGNLSSMAGITTTGFIPVKAGAKTIRIAGDGISIDSEYTRFSWYDSNFTHQITFAYKALGSGSYFPVEIEESATALTMQMSKGQNGQDGVYMRICTKGDGVNLIVTVDEEITYGGDGGTGTVNYTVVKKLTNVSSNNTNTVVTSGNSYSTTLTANSGYELSSVTVTMGGLDITSTAYANGVVTIAKVTGNVVIIANAASTSTASYTNQIPLSTTEIGGSELYNSPYGYKTGYRINSSNAEVEATGMCCTGFIPVKAGDVIRIKNVTVAGTKSPYLLFYTTTGTGMDTLQQDILTNGGTISSGDVSVTIDADGTIVVTSKNNLIVAMRLSVGVIDDSSIITVNEKIE